MHRSARTLLTVCVVLLLVIGVSMLYSTSYTAWGESLLKRQLLWIGAGAVGALVIAWRLDYRVLGKYSWWLLGMFALLLGYLALANILYRLSFVPKSITDHMPFIAGLTKGSSRWLRIWKFSLQPSEFAKLAIVLLLANYLPRHARHTREFYRGFLKPLGAVGLVVALILLGGDLSTTAIAGCTVGALAFIGGVRLRYLVLITILGLSLAIGAIASSEERISRITSYRNPESVQQTDGYQLWHSQLALGSGGWTGLGFTQSRMKRYYLPEAHTDFIVAIIGEELGFVGVAGLVVLYLGVVAAGLWMAVLAVDREGALICCGVALSFGLHALINISVVSGFCPTTGVTAPLVSYGGSSIVSTLLSMGLMLSVVRVAEQEHAKASAAAPVPAERPFRQLAYRRRNRSK
ncbi:MAG: FtsW/RodA/SpoVE family cell cycle protein [Candidatus Pacebacteria bacterium]|nr:FtsW/RodA/SpoVE family cell cycle protein [Candidatus Paceibacterota bacterium]